MGCFYLSLRKTPFSLNQLNLNGVGYSLPMPSPASSTAMFTIIFSLFSSIRQGFRTRAALHAEIANRLSTTTSSLRDALAALAQPRTSCISSTRPALSACTAGTRRVGCAGRCGVAWSLSSISFSFGYCDTYREGRGERIAGRSWPRQRTRSAW